MVGSPARAAAPVTAEGDEAPDPFVVGLSDERTWDLRGVTQRTPADPPFTSYTIQTRHIRLAKIGRAKEIRFESRTNGTDGVIQCLSHPDRSRTYIRESAGYTGEQEMKVRHIAIDVSDIPMSRELELVIQTTSWDSLQVPEDYWVGVAGYPRADVVSLLILFPDDRPYSDYELTVSTQTREGTTPFPGPRALYADSEHRNLYWRIPEPQNQMVYMVRWTW
jgi:hypothetical protein